MFGFARSKDMKKEFEKISEEFSKNKDKINSLKKSIKDLRKEFITEKEAKLMIKESILELKENLLVQSEPNSGLNKIPENVPEETFKDKIVKRFNKKRPEIIKTAIRKFIEENMKTNKIFNIIVSEKKLCGKTQFYHYLSLIKAEISGSVRTEPNPEIIAEIDK